MPPVLASSLLHLRARWRLLAAVAAVAVSARCAADVPEARTFEAVLETVERTAGMTPTTAAWEPSRGRLVDLVAGRPLLMTARPPGVEAQDVFRVFVRVAPDGAPLDVRRVFNLTDTALADERALVVRGPLATFATVAFEHVQSLTVLDGSGVYVGDGARGWAPTLLHRLELSVGAMLETGTLQGLGRTDVEFLEPPAELEFELAPQRLTLTAGERRWQLENSRTGLALAEAGETRVRPADPDLQVLPRISPPKPLLHWMADAGRSVVGAGPIAWLEGRVFHLLDRARRFSYGLTGSDDEVHDDPPRPTQLRLAQNPEDGAPSGKDPVWPPPDIASLWKTPRPGEGIWQPVTLPLLRKTPGAEDAPPYFFRTFVRPDRERPYAEVTLVAMDMRRLELGMEAGYEDPRPSAGPPGTGHVPEDPETYRRIVATFNGAFKTTHGEYGMVVNRRVLVPPRAGAATVRVDRSGTVGLGTWPKTAPAVGSGKPPAAPGETLPLDLVSLRQNLDPLIEDGVINPHRRAVWGSQLYGQGVAAERSALCVTGAGHLVYAWSEEVSGETLAEALRMSGCDYGVHLDMNPGHCAFMFTDILDVQRVEARAEVLDPRMRINPTRYVRWSPKDFFYVTLREPIPQGDPGWSIAPGAQPEPSWLPGIFQANVPVGPLQIEVLRFEAERVRWQAVAGSSEPLRPGVTPERSFSEEDARNVQVAIGLGHGTAAARHGLAIAGQQLVPLDPRLATLVLPQSGPARLDPPGTPLRVEKGTSLVQLPLLAQDGELVGRARQVGALRDRGALCLDADGNLLFAQITHDSSGPAARALLQLGCGLVVEADRGSHHPPFVERAGTAQPPRVGHETTALYGVGQPMRPRAYWWRPGADSP